MSNKLRMNAPFKAEQEPYYVPVGPSTATVESRNPNDTSVYDPYQGLKFNFNWHNRELTRKLAKRKKNGKETKA